MVSHCHHVVEVCPHGARVRQCRCPGPLRRVVDASCPVHGSHHSSSIHQCACCTCAVVSGKPQVTVAECPPHCDGSGGVVAPDLSPEGLRAEADDCESVAARTLDASDRRWLLTKARMLRHSADQADEVRT